jgi:hypothetical protein
LPSLELSQRVLDAIGDRVGIRCDVNVAVIGESGSGEFDVNVGVLEVGMDAFLQEEQMYGVTNRPPRLDGAGDDV